MGMFGARFAVFVRRARVLPSPCPATRNLSFVEVSPAPSPCCFNSLCIGMVRVGVKISRDGNRTNVHGHSLMVFSKFGARFAVFPLGHEKNRSNTTEIGRVGTTTMQHLFTHHYSTGTKNVYSNICSLSNISSSSSSLLTALQKHSPFSPHRLHHLLLQH